MKLPNKCGSVYIKFDDDNNPEYGFVVDEKSRTKSIRNFLIMTNKKIDTIVLPNLVPNSIISAEELKKGSDELANNDSFGRYVLGEVKICKNCFDNIFRIDCIYSKNFDRVFIGLVRYNEKSYIKTFIYDISSIDRFILQSYKKSKKIYTLKVQLKGQDIQDLVLLNKDCCNTRDLLDKLNEKVENITNGL